MHTIYVAGTPLLETDALPLKIMGALAKEFPQLAFREFDPTENFPEEKNMVILDTVIGLGKVTLLQGQEPFELSPSYSLHDFDLAVNLKLMKKAGLLQSFKIIGIPPHMREKEAAQQVKKVISSLL